MSPLLLMFAGGTKVRTGRMNVEQV
jgi:hypothetical protein